MWAVDYAKKHGVQVEFSAEDATRSEISFMKEVFQAVSQSGADRLDIPDTVGYSTPESISKTRNRSNNYFATAHKHALS